MTPSPPSSQPAHADAPACAALPAIVSFYEGLQPQDLPRLAQLYAHDARFKDPFNEVQGVASIEAVFAHMFRRLDAPRFAVRDRMAQGDVILLTWDFDCRFKGEATPRTIRGASRLLIDAQGQIADHRDYWDAAEAVYEQLPLLGGFMRWLKRQARKG
ncbi:MAG: nuclear transport factor 2 family protein [Aquabacterium sp.]